MDILFIMPLKFILPLLALIFIPINVNISIILFLLYSSLYFFNFMRKSRVSSSFNNSNPHKVSREILFRKINLGHGRNFKFSIELEVLENLLVIFGSFGFSNVYGGLSFSTIRDSNFLRNILLGIPYEYYLVLKGGKDSGELYFLIINAKFNFYNRDSVISKILELINSLSISIPARDVKIMSGDEILKNFLNFNGNLRCVKIV